MKATRRFMKASGQALGLLWLAGHLAAGVSPAVAGDSLSAGEVERYVRYGFTLQNETGQLVPAADLWVCAPLKATSLQQRRDLKASRLFDEVTDSLGNQVLHFAFSNIPPYAVRIVTVEATVALRTQGEPADLAPGAWLQAGPLYEYDQEAFTRLAPEFPRGDAAQTARAIFDWVRQNVQDIGYDGTDRGALHALTEKKGDCTEFATLFAALCRRTGIPARAMGGYMISQNTALDPAAFHNWAEFYLNGAWHLADPQSGVFDEKSEQYVATRVLGPSDSPLENFARFRYTGPGIKAVMNK